MRRKQSLLVIDTPKSCYHCKLVNCKFRNTIYDRMIGLDCPLQPVAPLLEALESLRFRALESRTKYQQENIEENYNKLYSVLSNDKVAGGGKDE